MDTENKHIVPIELITRFLANEASVNERTQVEDWRSAASENEKEFQSIRKLWNVSATLGKKEEIDIDKEWQIMDKAITPAKGRVISLARVIQIAASLLILVTLSFLVIQQSKTISQKTAVAEVTQVTLPDGSIINLNANSKITYGKDFGTANREITLKGEGFFEVVSNKNMPFIISAQGATIQVLGTQFNVKAYKNQEEVKVTVIEGVVELSEAKQPTKKTVLLAGETGIYMKKKKAIKKKPSNDLNDISWKTKYLSFENTPLNQVIDILNNTYHKDFVVDNKVKDCKVTVAFRDKDLASVLKVLKSTLELHITLNNQVFYITGEGCQK
ncbi:MAG: FecR domain-containing protein [Salinivirgaceae bacterium]|nr:FecR domain-containing protein [Salinivirgaceae bacterium]